MSEHFPTPLVLYHLEGSDPALVGARNLVRHPSPQYARVSGDEDWPRTRASLQLAMQHARIDAMSDETLTRRVSLGFKL